MEVKNKKTNKKFKVIILYILLVVLIFSYVLISGLNLYKVFSSNDTIYSNIYLGEFDLSGYSFDRVNSKIDFYKEFILDKNVKIECNGKEYNYTFEELGLEVDTENIINNIKIYQNDLSYSKKIRAVNGDLEKEVFDYIFKMNDESVKKFLNVLKLKTDQKMVAGYFKC